jgi:hypothetical protein
MDDWKELFANQITSRQGRQAGMCGSGRIAMPREYFVIDMDWLIDDPHLLHLRGTAEIMFVFQFGLSPRA